jgi:hypothetical protein
MMVWMFMLLINNALSSNNPSNTIEQKLFINGTLLTQIGSYFCEKSTKFLGLHVDEFLLWKNHLAQINKKISYALFMTKQAKNILSVDVLKTLYFALIHPHLTYGILAE